LPVIILGGIFGGIFTVTESAAVAVIYAFLASIFIYKELSFNDLLGVVKKSVKDSAQIMIIIACAALFGWMLSVTRIPHMIADFAASVSPNVYVFLLLVNLFLLFTGTFLEGIAALVLLIPIFQPMLVIFGIDPVHFGTIMVLNLMLGLLTPPVGLAMYVTGEISNVPIEKVFRESFPFLIVGLIVLVLVTYFPQISLFLPRILGFY